MQLGFWDIQSKSTDYGENLKRRKWYQTGNCILHLKYQ